MSTAEPILVYDDDCGVCTRAAEWIARHGDVELRGFSDLSEEEIERLPEDWEECAHLLTGEETYSCGKAMEEAFLRTDDAGTALVRVAREIPGYASLRDWGYRLFAEHRGLVGRVLH